MEGSSLRSPPDLLSLALLLGGREALVCYFRATRVPTAAHIGLGNPALTTVALLILSRGVAVPNAG